MCLQVLPVIYLPIYSNIISWNFIFVSHSSTVPQTVLKTLCFRHHLRSMGLMQSEKYNCKSLSWGCAILLTLCCHFTAELSTAIKQTGRGGGWEKAAGIPNAMKFQLKMKKKLACFSTLFPVSVANLFPASEIRNFSLYVGSNKEEPINLYR